MVGATRAEHALASNVHTFVVPDAQRIASHPPSPNMPVVPSPPVVGTPVLEQEEPPAPGTTAYVAAAGPGATAGSPGAAITASPGAASCSHPPLLPAEQVTPQRTSAVSPLKFSEPEDALVCLLAQKPEGSPDVTQAAFHLTCNFREPGPWAKWEAQNVLLFYCADFNV